jgi:hypothetical protein
MEPDTRAILCLSAVRLRLASPLLLRSVVAGGQEVLHSDALAGPLILKPPSINSHSQPFGKFFIGCPGFLVFLKFRRWHASGAAPHADAPAPRSSQEQRLTAR